MNGPITIGKYFGKPKKYKNPKPTFRLRGYGQEIFDGTTLCLIIHGELAKKKAANSKHDVAIIKAFEYLNQKTKHGLLWDGVMAEWNDTAYKYGNLLYSNILFWYAAKLHAKFLSKTSQFNELDKKIAEQLHHRLWNGNYFADWHDYKRQDYFYPFGNLLAIIWGLANSKEAQSILKHAENSRVNFTLETNTPKYPFWRIDIGNHLIGMGDYQNKSTLWWQPATTYLKALQHQKKYQKFKEYHQQLVDKITSDQGFHECYTRDGQPLKKLFYQSEKPFAWAAGLYLWASS